jgi:hypothetical protein
VSDSVGAVGVCILGHHWFVRLKYLPSAADPLSLKPTPETENVIL